jgi:hypothetical protein
MRSIARKLKSLMRPEKRRPSPDTPPLLACERESLYALFETVTAHEGFSRIRFERYLDTRPDLVVECRVGVTLLDRLAGERFNGLAFATLTRDARNTVLEGIFRKYAYRSSHAAILDRLGLTADNLDLVLAGRDSKSLRQFVVREFVEFYYDEPEGWLVAGYEKARGHAREEAVEGMVTAVVERAGRLWLELADGTIEEYAETTPADSSGDTVWVKGGRQKARLAPEVQAQLKTVQSTPVESRAVVGPKEVSV